MKAFWRSRGDRLPKIVFGLSCAFLLFIAGIFFGLFNLEPAASLRRAILMADQVYAQVVDRPADPFDRDYNLWVPARPTTWTGTTAASLEMYGDYTLFSDLTREEARLIDASGRVVHRWSLPQEAYWRADSGLPQPSRQTLLRWDKVQLFPDGRLLAVVMATNATPYGRGLVMMDRDSRPLWSYQGYAHHSFAVTPEGHIFTLGQRIVEQAPGEVPARWTPYIGDQLLELDANGRLLREIDLVQAIVDSPLAGIAELVREHRNGDLFHANDVEYIDAALAEAHPYARPGEVLVSFRELNLLALVEPATGTLDWAITGPWVAQHDPDLLANGHILLFDNRGGLRRSNASRVLEIDPETRAIVWSYEGSLEDPLDSPTRGSQERLPNGNTLITDSWGGRLLEVAPDGHRVWQYWNPGRPEEAPGMVASIRSGTRYRADQIHFLFNDGQLGGTLADAH